MLRVTGILKLRAFVVGANAWLRVINARIDTLPMDFRHARTVGSGFQGHCISVSLTCFSRSSHISVQQFPLPVRLQESCPTVLGFALLHIAATHRRQRGYE
ncbi:hypothetical protein F4819DRAFT_435383 [Hypoxylon fuscum]|nr:hypothetical protein F4819DRAFT_435383 [Hypoxylon fuscum]